MKLYFTNKLSDKDKAALTQLSFDLSSLKKVQMGRFSFMCLDVPENPRIICYKTQETEELCHTDLYYNDILVLSVNAKDTHYESYAILRIQEEKIQEALLLDNTTPIPEKQEPTKLTDFQKKVESYLHNLSPYVYSDLCYRGYGSQIEGIIEQLAQLRKSNVDEHDSLINTNSRYLHLFNFFSGWDVHSRNIQKLIDKEMSACAVMTMHILFSEENNVWEGKRNDISDWNIPLHKQSKNKVSYSQSSSSQSSSSGFFKKESVSQESFLPGFQRSFLNK